MEIPGVKQVRTAVTGCHTLGPLTVVGALQSLAVGATLCSHQLWVPHSAVTSCRCHTLQSPAVGATLCSHQLSVSHSAVTNCRCHTAVTVWCVRLLPGSRAAAPPRWLHHAGGHRARHAASPRHARSAPAAPRRAPDRRRRQGQWTQSLQSRSGSAAITFIATTKVKTTFSRCSQFEKL